MTVDWPYVLLFALPAFFLQTLVHESAHAAVARLQGLTIESFKIWPHFVDHDNDPSTRELYFWGRVVYSNAWNVPVSDTGTALRAGVPLIVGTILLVVLVLLKLSVGIHAHNVLLTGWNVWMVAVGTDLTRGWLQAFTRRERGDVNKARDALDASVGATRLVATAGIFLAATTVTIGLLLPVGGD